mgnify:CR=1 FL=1
MNIKITKSSYKTKENKGKWHERYIRFDTLNRIVIADGFDNLFLNKDIIQKDNTIVRQNFDKNRDTEIERDFITLSTSFPFSK